MKRKDEKPSEIDLLIVGADILTCADANPVLPGGATAVRGSSIAGVGNSDEVSELDLHTRKGAGRGRSALWWKESARLENGITDNPKWGDYLRKIEDT
jgi:hypothetical protein